MVLPAEPPPILLTKADALTFCAELLERRSHEMDLIALISASLDKPERDPALRDKLEELRRICPEPKIQQAAMREAAKAIRELAIEERLMAARAGVARVSTAGRS